LPGDDQRAAGEPAAPAEEPEFLPTAETNQLAAFEKLVRRNQTVVYRVALRMLGNGQDAQDATQDAFVQAWRALPYFRGESSLETWLYRIVTNRCLNLLRTRHSAEPLLETREASLGHPNHLAETRSELDALKDAIVRLPPDQRATLVLRELEGLSYEEIAHVLGTTVPAVKGRLHRARLELLHAMRGWR
jgi:RNA polymerase sigma-70 factor (ECF subfamily)